MNSDRMRFEFGRNWSRFVRHNFSQERCDIAKRRILDFVGHETLEGFDFLDIGCGSGINSLAAWQAGARKVHSFDYDFESVSATEVLRGRAGSPSNWTVERGDVLNTEYISSLGKWNFVYSWGVLHHTGAMWSAVSNAQSTVNPNGLFYIALYSSDVQSPIEQQFWLDIKQRYNHANLLQREGLVWWYVWNYILGRRLRNFPELVRRVRTYKRARGMSFFTDVRDWLGGWPMEYAGDQETVDFLEQRGFSLENIARGEACTEFLFRYCSVPQRSLVQGFAAQGKREPTPEVA